jgi:outer membrane protein assembly factor BamB
MLALISACVGIALPGALAWAQIIRGQVGVAQIAQADDLPAAEQPQGVFVRESEAALDTFQNGQRMERLKEWAKAADFYQEVVEKYRDRVIPSAQDADHHATQYTSIVQMVQEQLSKWPPEGREVYLARYEVPAAALLKSAGGDEPAALHQVYERYFVTEAGKQAGIALMDGYLEGGEYRAAAGIGERLLTWHPDIAPDAAAVLYRTALAYHFAGNEPSANAMAAKLKADHPNDHGMIRGQDVVLADSLQAELKGSAASVESATGIADAGSWPMAWGDPSRSRISTGQGNPGIRLFAIPLSKPNYATSGVQPQQRTQLEQGFSAEVAQGNTIGIMPVTDHGALFFQDGQRIYARDLDSNLPLPGWAQTYPASGDYTLPNASGSARTNQLTVTVTSHEVLAVMGQPDRQAIAIGMPPQGETRLVCLDRDSGKEKWIVSPSAFPDSAAALRDVQLTGSPLVVGESVLLLGHGGSAKQLQFDDTYVVSVDLRTGKYQWSCYVASANVGGLAGLYSMFDENTSHLAYADGLVFAQTNLGAIAAIDPFSQSLVWVDIYPTRGGMMEAINPFQPMIAQQQGTGRMPWTSNPVIASNGRIFTLPQGGKDLLIYDSITGAPVKHIPLSDLRDCDTLLGVVGDRVILSGQKVVVSVDWNKYDPRTFTSDDLNSLVFDDSIRGRGFVTTTRIFVPFKDRLYWLDPTANMVLGAYPPHPREWEDGQGPGNVLVTDDHVIIAGATSVDVYTDLTVARGNLDRLIAANPSDAELRLRYAVLMFGAKDPDAAMQRLEEAVALLGGKEMRVGPQRDEVFADAMGFAGTLAADERPDLRERAKKFYDCAASAAFTPLQQIRSRIARAQLAVTMKDPVTAVKLYQEILSEERLRAVSLNDPQTSSPTPAALVAERGIAALIKTNPEAYAPFEQAASDAFAEAKGASDDLPTRLMTVAKTYPNSSIAPQAMLAAADAYESAGNPRMALQVVRQLYFRTPEGGADLPRILETMARNYLMIPGRPDVVMAAEARLEQGAALPGDPMLEKPLRLPNNQILEPMHFSQALEAVRKYSGAEAIRTLPDFNLPVPGRVTSADGRSTRPAQPKPFLPPGPQDVIGDIQALLRPLRDSARSDRIVALGTNGKLEIFAPGRAEPLAIGDLPADEAPSACAWLGNNLLVWGAAEMSLFPEDGGSALWTMKIRQLAATEVMHGADSPAPVAAAAPDANGVFFAPNRPQFIIRGRGRVILNGAILRGIAINNQIGNPAPAAAPAATPEQITDVIPVGDRVLLSTTAGRIICVDLTQGVPVWQMHLSDRPIDRLVANEDFAVALVTDADSVRLVAIDTFSGEPRGNKSFATGDNQNTPVNLALSADGTLVYTLPDRLCLKNLYAPWPDPSDREVIAGNGTTPFRVGDDAASAPDQLVIAEGRILALADEGARKIVRVHSLETGNPVPLRFTSPQGNEQVDRVLGAGATWKVCLRVLGSHLYVVGPDIEASYNLDQPAESWVKQRETSPVDVRDVMIGKKYLVIIEGPQATDDDNSAAPKYVIRAIGLYPASPTTTEESGRTDVVHPVTDPGLLTGDWQGVDGGFYYLTADHKLHMLMGAAGSGK